MANRNLELLKAAANHLIPVLDDLVFVGGCITGLLISDEAAADVRPTLDVDAIAEITSYAGYASFSERLRELGFEEDSGEDAPVCRWRHGEIKLDVMPLDEKILGFSNRWYKPAIETAPEDVRLYIAGAIKGLLEADQFMDALPGYLLPDAASQARLSILLERLRQISSS